MISYWLSFECHYLWTIARRQTGECAPTIKMEIVLSVLSLDPGVCRCAYDLSIVLVKIVVFCTHRRNLLASTTHKFRQILNLARPGRGTGESTIKMSISCTFCHWIEPYSLGEAAFCPYFRSSSMTVYAPSQWSPIGCHSNAIIFGPSLGARKLNVRQPSTWQSYCPFCLLDPGVCRCAYDLSIV